jgi:hypothetical protein
MILSEENKINQEKTVVRAFWGKLHWAMNKNKVSKFSSTSLLTTFLIAAIV